MNAVFSNKTTIAIFVLPTVVLFCAIVLIPIFVSSYYSLLDWNGIGKGVFIGLDNYVEMFKDPRVLNSIKNSLLFAGASVFIQLPISLLLALVLASSVKGEGFYRTVYFIPVLISTVVIAQLWSKIYNADYGLLNALLESVGLSHLAQDWLGQKNTALAASFVPTLWQYVGYHMLLMYAGAKSISQDIVEAAKMDGASRLRTAFSITIPLMRPILKVCLIFSVIGAFKVFDLIYVLTGGGPLFTTEVPSTLMYSTIFSTYRYGYGSAISVFIILECLICTVLINKWFKTD
ncbi:MULTISPECIES: carbohydrate ABC transporter permease [Paenibacillus]|uniref:Raffinose/stachyose/melibiose transport system permease protein n=1 Tax=Paenibacillus pabuli TaxID=1472 RepID=A0A855XZ15_9BACL|nr:MULTISPECIES: sugar ABC transporter permease [Paenibacillus]PWW33710.1 raffinose/stachyose/melibiose transport system permease protein [Paenibacillus pabuli]PXV99980.1 raffinose/stachyose/melibiose transport system permease protein [Paenibacillus taichungensis]QLG37415.1 sugar ABC transporter permease [Paenibacillus sp. E222]RAI86869.1 raffinose/stachyose/melibiose transport system permease protein [Paenibacillus pabuli]SEP26442.1 raffinose/stachyose/melibiose transport system permease prot